MIASVTSMAVVCCMLVVGVAGCGCMRHLPTMYGVRVAAAGTGGAFCVYEDELGGLVYAQSISPQGKPMWADRGVRLVEGDSRSYSFPFIQVVRDGSGGVITSMPGTPSAIEPEGTFYVFRVACSGDVDLLSVRQHIDEIAGDGSGGVVFDYREAGEALKVIRVSASGDRPWARNGVSVEYPANSISIAADGLGGVVIAREELRHPEDARPGEAFSRHYIYAHRISPEGHAQWGDEGILLYSTAEDVFAESVQVIGDEAGGAIIAWLQHPLGRIDSGSEEALKMDILLQKVAADGSVLWREGGLPLEINKYDRDAFPLEPRVASDGSGGAIVIWRDMRDGPAVYAQRVEAGGGIRWKDGGVKVASTALNPFSQIAEDEAGGAIVSCARDAGLYIQKVNGDGEAAWPENGVQVIKGDYDAYTLVPDGLGGALVGWGMRRGLFRGERAYVQRISDEGEMLWGRRGIRLNP